MDEVAKDDLTPDEMQAMEETDMSGEEAHRFGEYEELRDMLSSVLDGISALRESIGSLVLGGAVIDEGAAVDVDGDGDEDIIIGEPEFTSMFDDLDLTM